MVETQQDDSNDYGNTADEDGELPRYLTSEYFDRCLLDALNEDAESNVRTTSSNSNSRPASRYDRDLDIDAELELYDSNKKSDSNGTLNDHAWKFMTSPSDD